MGYNYLGLYYTAVQDMEGDQVKYGWTMFDAMDLKQEYRNVPIMAGDTTTVPTLMIYPSHVVHLTVRISCIFVKHTRSK